MMEPKRNYIFFILLYLSQFNVLCQQEVFTQLSVNEGLSHSDATSIVQDNYSYLWIGTHSGLNKYDGYAFETYKWEPGDDKSIPGNRILKLIATKDKIWVLIENKGLYYFNLLTKSYVLVKKIPKLDPGNFMFDLDQDKNLWVFHRTIGLIKTTILDEPSLLKDNITKENILFKEKKVSFPELRKLIKIGDKKYFISIDGQVYKYSKKVNKLSPYYDFEANGFRTALINSDSDVLVGLDNGLYLWNSNLKTKQKIPILFNNTISKKIELNCIYKDNKTYYLGTENGLYEARLVVKNGLKLIIDSEAISGVKVHSIFKDKFNILWVGSSAYGLSYKNLERLPFGHIKKSDFINDNSFSNLSKNFTSSILKERGTNSLWLGTKNGLFIYNLKQKKFSEQLKELTNQVIKFIFQDSRGEIWVSTDNGVYRYRSKKLIKHYIRLPRNNNCLSSNNIISISEDYTGKIWFANYSSGIDIFNKNDESFTHLFSESFNSQSLGSNNLTYLYFDKGKKRMYVSSRDAGITVIDLFDKTKLSYKHINTDTSPIKLSTNYIWSINSNNSDTIYVGTIGGGLNILKTNKNNEYEIEYVTRSKGLADNDIEAVLLDSQNRVWMGGLGLSVYNPKTKNISNYNVNDGLQSNSFKIGSSFYDVKEGIMYFGGVNGVNFFDPNNIKKSTVPSDVSITGIEIFNKLIKIGDTLNNRVLLHSKITDSTTINLKAQENDFSLNITPLNFISPKRNKIKYRLLPYQENWVFRSYPNFKATYSNLPAGEYTFEVQTSNNDEIWSSKNYKLKIRLEKFWYTTNFALFIYFICLLGLIYFYQIQTANRRKIKEKLITAEKEQLLNQGKLDFFTKISHEIRTPLTLIAGPLNDLIQKRKTTRNKEEILTSMSRHVNRLLNMVNRLLDFRKMELGHDVLMTSPTEINEFVYDIFMFFRGKAFSKVINYEFNKLPQEITLYVDREKIETILINLLSNAFKFTPNNGSITMKLEIKGDKNKDALFNDYFEPIENYLEISITDTGMGIPLAKKDKIFNQYYQIEENSSFEAIGNGIGLALVKSICTLHHLKIEVESTAKMGSTFSIRIPLGKNYIGNDEIKDITSYAKFSSPVVLHQTPIIEFNESTSDIIDRDLSINKKVLVVEDNAEIRLYLNQHLKEYFKVLNAENGALGFEIAMKERPDIIISDVMMPEMNGMEFSKLIKTNEELHHIPIILLTALASTLHELEGLKLGIEDYIRKPFDIEILLAKIFTILENRKFISEYYAKQLHFRPDSMDGLNDDEIFLQKLIKLIEDNITNEELNVNFISSYMAMGRTTLYVKIKEITGRSIIEFIRDIRLKKAKNILLSTSQTIEQISYYVGINDLKYFRKHFKAMYKISPSQYRKSKI
jgi:signal transduction histidine kinase/ligand-binding sensor domain-containing protein/AraC-like DNA-binding protein